MGGPYVFRAPPARAYPLYFRQHPSELNQLRWLFNRATQQYVVVSGPNSGPNSLLYGAVPPVAAGAILIADLLDSEGDPITLRADGTFSVAAAVVDSDRSFSYNVYRPTTSSFDGVALAYVNYPSPVATTADIVIAVERGQTITPVDFTPYLTDPLGNALTFFFESSPPGTLDTNSVGVMAGTTPNANSITAESIEAFNIAGDATSLAFTLIVGNVVTPNIGGESLSQLTGSLAAVYLSPVLGGPPEYSATVALDTVLRQNPAAGNESAPFATVAYVLSAGTTGHVSIISQPVSVTYTENLGIKTLNFAQFFSGAGTYSMTGGFSNNETLVGSLFSFPTATVGTFGPFTVSGASATETATLNPFYYTVLQLTGTVSGGVIERPTQSLRDFLIGHA